MDPNDRFSHSGLAVVREMGGELVLLQLESGYYFGLNQVGTMVWKLLEPGKVPLSELCDAVVNEFDAPRAEIKNDIKALLQSLEEEGLVRCEENG